MINIVVYRYCEYVQYRRQRVVVTLNLAYSKILMKKTKN